MKIKILKWNSRENAVIKTKLNNLAARWPTRGQPVYGEMSQRVLSFSHALQLLNTIVEKHTASFHNTSKQTHTDESWRCVWLHSGVVRGGTSQPCLRPLSMPLTQTADLFPQKHLDAVSQLVVCVCAEALNWPPVAISPHTLPSFFSFWSKQAG